MAGFIGPNGAKPFDIGRNRGLVQMLSERVVWRICFGGDVRKFDVGSGDFITTKAGQVSEKCGRTSEQAKVHPAPEGQGFTSKLVGVCNK